jgi:serine/threonine-protein kinase
MDPMVERVILRCLEKDPSQRPRSATQLALALPGGDPLAAAIAAGETPSPEMVAAAGGEGALRPARAWALLLAILILLGGVAALSPHSTDLGLAPPQMSPDGLRDRARAILERGGYGDAPADEAAWLARDYDSIRWLADHLPSPEWRARLPHLGAPMDLHYRRSAKPLLPANAAGIVTEADPPAGEPGDIQVVVDANGRLRRLRVMPPRLQEESSVAAVLSDEAIFAEAGLEPGRFTAAPPTWIPPLPFDARREWTGSRAEAPEIPLRLSVATLAGRLVSVETLGPWDDRPISVLESSLPSRIARATLATGTRRSAP